MNEESVLHMNSKWLFVINKQKSLYFYYSKYLSSLQKILGTEVSYSLVFSIMSTHFLSIQCKVAVIILWFLEMSSHHKQQISVYKRRTIYVSLCLVCAYSKIPKELK